MTTVVLFMSCSHLLALENITCQIVLFERQCFGVAKKQKARVFFILPCMLAVDN